MKRLKQAALAVLMLAGSILVALAMSGCDKSPTGGGPANDSLGTTWTVRNSGTVGGLNSVAWTGSQFVAVGSYGTILTSPDGKTWTSQSSGTSVWLSSVAWTGSQLVVVGGLGIMGSDNVTILTSPDGVNWTVREHASDSTRGRGLNSVTWTGSHLVAVGTGGGILTSPDGITWTSHDYAGMENSLFSVTWTGNQLVAVGDHNKGMDSRSMILTSPDGVNWTQRFSVSEGRLYSVVWSGSQLVAVGYDNNSAHAANLFTSPDGVTWSSRGSGLADRLTSVAWTGSHFVAVGVTPLDNVGLVVDSLSVGVILTSPDGVTWTPRASEVTKTMNSVVSNGSRVVAVGDSGVIVTSP